MYLTNMTSVSNVQQKIENEIIAKDLFGHVQFFSPVDSHDLFIFIF